MPGEKTYSAALYYIKDVTGLLFKNEINYAWAVYVDHHRCFSKLERPGA